MKSKTKDKTNIIVGLLVVTLAVTAIQGYKLVKLSSEIQEIRSTQLYAANVNQASSSNTLQQILDEITPRGTPDYGKEAGVSYDKVESSLKVLMGYATLQLTQEEQERYNEIASVDGTACNYCCGATRLDQNCGCAHNIALQGLVKWLIKNTNYSNEDILKEIRNWQILFFPEPTLREELQKRNINPETVGLPTMRGGC